MKSRLFFLFLFVTTKLTIGQGINDLRKLFEYDKSQAIGMHVLKTTDTLQATIQDIVFTSTSGLRVTACLVLPRQKLRAFPAVIFQPGCSQNKTGLVPEALGLAGEAIASFIMDSPPDRPENCRYTYQNYLDPIKDFKAYRQTVMDLRRAIDLLEQHERIVNDRIAFIGFGKGAMTGAVLSGVDIRILNYILVAGPASYLTELQTSTDPNIEKCRNSITADQLLHYESIMKPIGTASYLANHRNNLIFFQFVQTDPETGADGGSKIFQLTTEPKTRKIYKVENQSLTFYPEAVADRKNWLRDHL
jgi:hypothetical protein